MKEHTEIIIKRFDRFARFYDLFESPMEIFVFNKWREKVWKEARGKVLEIGVGTGKNMEYYPENLEITAIDFSKKMLEKAKIKAKNRGIKLNLVQMDIQNMDFDDNTFDTVIGTFVFCSVPDPLRGLKEVKRVCKRGGRIILLEHVRHPNKIIGFIMDVLNPLIVKLIGVNINRETVKNVKRSGLKIKKVEKLSSIVRLIHAAWE